MSHHPFLTEPYETSNRILITIPTELSFQNQKDCLTSVSQSVTLPRVHPSTHNLHVLNPESSSNRFIPVSSSHDLAYHNKTTQEVSLSQKINISVQPYRQTPCKSIHDIMAASRKLNESRSRNHRISPTPAPISHSLPISNIHQLSRLNDQNNPACVHPSNGMLQATRSETNSNSHKLHDIGNTSEFTVNSTGSVMQSHKKLIKFTKQLSSSNCKLNDTIVPASPQKREDTTSKKRRKIFDQCRRSPSPKKVKVIKLGQKTVQNTIKHHQFSLQSSKIMISVGKQAKTPSSIKQQDMLHSLNPPNNQSLVNSNLRLRYQTPKKKDTSRSRIILTLNTPTPLKTGIKVFSSERRSKQIKQQQYQSALASSAVIYSGVKTLEKSDSEMGKTRSSAKKTGCIRLVPHKVLRLDLADPELQNCSHIPRSNSRVLNTSQEGMLANMRVLQKSVSLHRLQKSKVPKVKP